MNPSNKLLLAKASTAKNRFSMTGRRAFYLLVLSLGIISGCHSPPLQRLHVGVDAIPTSLPNPMVLNVSDREFLWNHAIDTLDDYFQIDREQPVRLVDNVLIEGRADTYPETGSTLLEPWKKDSTIGYEKLHATLQSIRRRAILRVVPTGAGYEVEVVVTKEIEDVNRPEFSTVGATTIRHDGTIIRNEEFDTLEPTTLGWIPIGRDLALEQTILADLRARMVNVIPGN